LNRKMRAYCHHEPMQLVVDGEVLDPYKPFEVY
jgi:hypothetical protein